MKIAYLVLGHQHPDLIGRLARLLATGESRVALHYDAKSGNQPFDNLRSDLQDLGDRIIWADRTEVRWGEWSILQATLNGLNAIRQSGADPDYVQFLSGHDYPIRPPDDFGSFLERNGGQDFVELHNMHESVWVRGGLHHERYRYRHFFNWKKHPRLFGVSWRVQRALRLKRKFPKGLVPHMGSQWMTLRWETCLKVLELAEDPEIQRFAKRVWIADELIIQTIVANLVPQEQISNRCLTLYQFSDYGVPLVYANGHDNYLTRQPFFFARKISPYGLALRDQLDLVAAGERPVSTAPDEHMGRRTTEYETFRQSRRNATGNKRVVGHVDNPWFGDLEWNRRPYFVLMGACHEELQSLRRVVDSLPGIRCHGNLFAAGQIEFADQAECFAGYRRSDVALRDHAPTNFLTDVIMNSGPDRIGLVLPWNTARKMLDVTIYDPRARVIVVKGNMLRALIEAHSADIAPGNRDLTSSGADPRFPGPAVTVPVELMGWFQREYCNHYSELQDKLSGSVDRHVSLDLLDDSWCEQLFDFCARDVDLGNFDRTGTKHSVLGGDNGMAAALSDPFRRIANAAELIDMIDDAHHRTLHRHALGASAPGKAEALEPDQNCDGHETSKYA